MDDRAPILAAAAGVVAPVATVHLVGRAVTSGLVPPVGGLLVLLGGGASMAVGLVAAGWQLGVKEYDPFDRVRTKRTLRDQIPESHQAPFTQARLDQEVGESHVPFGLFAYGLCYAVGLIAFTLLFLL